MVALEKRIDELAEKIKNHEGRLKEIESLISTKQTGKKTEAKTEAIDVVEAFKALELSEFSYVFRLSGLPLFLAVLHIARERLDFDGLTPPEISAMCKDKIRISKGTNRTTVSHTLSDAGAKVDRIGNPRGKGFAYRIMRDGEDFLQEELKRVSVKK